MVAVFSLVHRIVWKAFTARDTGTSVAVALQPAARRSPMPSNLPHSKELYFSKCAHLRHRRRHVVPHEGIKNIQHPERSKTRAGTTWYQSQLLFESSNGHKKISGEGPIAKWPSPPDGWVPAATRPGASEKNLAAACSSRWRAYSWPPAAQLYFDGGIGLRC
jgi:hypothetical protein